MRASNTVALASLLIRVTSAVPWLELSPTPQGLLADAGVSPRPTEAPGSNGVPRELSRRQQNIIYPPPASWCGFVEADYSNPLTCRAGLTCVNSGYYVGCCSNTASACSGIYTTCHDFGDFCDSDCESDDKALKCSLSARPNCGTYRFDGYTRLYDCEATSALAATSVEFLADYYLTAISSSLPASNGFPAAKTSATRSSASSRASSALGYTSSYTPQYTSSSSYSSGSDNINGLSFSAIRGIAIGVSIGVFAIFVFLAIFIVRRRRANRIKKASQPNLPPAYSPSPAMMQQSNPVYQPVPQQDQSSGPPPPQAGYFSPSAPPGKNNDSTVTSQPAASPSPGLVSNPQQDPRHSVATTSLLSPNSTGGRNSYYPGIAPVSPTITEVDGTGRPLPEADSIQRPASTHQGMVSPLQPGSSPGSPPPGQSVQQYGNGNQVQQQNSGPIRNGYVAPHARTHELEPTQAYPGPYEMPSERH
ncbi:MAG: hypothetical protein Q9220_006924 [cf. Caloplaca sp. 1 TL-2023]